MTPHTLVCAVAAFSIVLQQSLPAGAVTECHLKANYMQKIQKQNCRPYMYKNSTICTGDCLNSIRPIQGAPYFENECRCCAPARIEKVHVHLFCSSGLILTPVARAQSCVCKRCSCSEPGATSCIP